jgi:hypothetical protein
MLDRIPSFVSQVGLHVLRGYDMKAKLKSELTLSPSKFCCRSAQCFKSSGYIESVLDVQGEPTLLNWFL